MTFEIRWKVTETILDNLMLTIEYRRAGKWMWKPLVDEWAEEKAYLWHAPVSLSYSRMTPDQRVMMLKNIIDDQYGGSMEEYVKTIATRELEQRIVNDACNAEAESFRNQLTSLGWRRTTVTIEEKSSK